jgi:hypothetical protein
MNCKIKIVHKKIGKVEKRDEFVIDLIVIVIKIRRLFFELEGG